MKKMAERKKLFVLFAIVTTVFIILSMARYRAIEAASRENVECLEPYIRRYGNSLVLALLSFEAALASLIIVPQKIVNFRQRSEWKKEVKTDRVEDR